MKRIFVVFVLFSAVFMISCGGSSVNNENGDGQATGNIGELNGECYPNNTCNKGLICDTEKNLCIEDAENQNDDSDTSSEENDDVTDTSPEQNDDNPDSTDDSDSVDPCKPNPCENLEHSTGVCTADGEKYVCGCDSNFEWNGVSCGAGTKKAQCEPKPANTVWNDGSANGTFEQTWNGSEWVPASYPSTFSKTPGTCTFKCASGSAWNGSSCDSAPTTVSDCTGLPENAIWNTTSAIVQTYDGVSWEPSTVGVYDITPSQSECHFICKPNYDWTGSQCVPATQQVECTGLPQNAEWNTAASITQTWNGSEWKPSANSYYSTSASTTECRYKCKLNYNWSDGECVAATRTVNCTTLPFGAQWNAVSSITQTWNGETWIPSNTTTYNTTQSSSECRYKCKTNYTWNSTQKECLADTQTSNCINLPEGAKWNQYSSVIQTWDGSSWQPAPTGVYNETPSQTQCRYVCDTNYTWNGSICKADSKVSNCEGKPANTVWNTAETISQTWDGNSWQPTTVGVYNVTASTSECRYKCQNDYFWYNSECVNPCDYEPCEGVENTATGTNSDCVATAWNEYSCQCKQYYAWSGVSCDEIPTCSTEQVTPCKYNNLLWSARSSNQMSWSAANSYCNNLEEADFTDWHLPKISELRTLIKNCSGTVTGGSCGVTDSCVYYPSCWTSNACASCSEDSSGGHSQFGETGWFWSSSGRSDYSGDAWAVNFGYGKVSNYSKTSTAFVRCVR